MSSCPETSALIEIAKLTIPALVVVVGWYIAHRLTAKRDRISELRKRAVDRCEGLIEEVTKVRELAMSYHTTERAIASELDIVARLADLSLGLPFLRQLGATASDINRCAALLLQFKQACTLSHFETEHQSPLPAGDEQLREISRTASALLRALRACHANILTN